MEDGERTKGKRTLPLPHYQIEHPLSAFSEAMRTLRSGIHMLDVDQAAEGHPRHVDAAG